MYRRKRIVSEFTKFENIICGSYDYKCTGCPIKRKDDDRSCPYVELKQGVLKEV